ncbi:MAG: polymerase subunit alpha [Patescibacteria group bacterium]|nr:polymerase subunit alpha [Patescibacteria group bacterium]
MEVDPIINPVTGKFVHLHVHSDYSMLDGINRIPEVVKKVKDDGMSALALTDHGVLYGVYDFYKACKSAEIKPIIGCEIYLAPGKKEVKEEIDGIKYYHLLLLAKNEIGYHNLIKIISRSHLEGFYYRPRADRELLEEFSEGIICSSACAVGPLSRHILRNEDPKAIDWLNFLKKNYKDDFYLELQRPGFAGTDNLKEINFSGLAEDHVNLLKEQTKINTKLREWSDKYQIPLIGTTDAHYLNADDEFTQEVAFAIKDGKRLSDPTRRLAYKHTYIKTQNEIAEVYKDLPVVLENTVKLAEKVEVYPIGYDRLQPKFSGLPDGKTARSYLRELCMDGAKLKYKNLSEDLITRIDMELDVIHDKGYDDYFLVVADIMRWSTEHDILVGVRGSVAGSVVAYGLNITTIDPIKWELYFERFLNPQRPSPPDIDMDIQDSRRDEVLKYVQDKFGEDCVAAISAFGRLRTRAAIRDVSRVMEIDLKIADELSKMVHVKFGRVKDIKGMLNDDKEFASIVNKDLNLSKMTEVVSKIEGLCRHVSTHACGYLITPTAIQDLTPLQYETGSSEKIITQLESKPLEELGFMKFDFLGLKNLTIIDKAIKLVKELHGTDVDIYTIPEDDKKTFKLFQEANTTSVFQFESEGMKKYLKDLKPESLEDICFMVAAYRPGPMKLIPEYIACKHGEKDPEYLIPELEPILSNTYGFAIYQEQVIRIAVEIAGYTMGEADLLRRAMGKKIPELMKSEEVRFVEGCVKAGFSKDIGKKLFEYMMPFADYGFNKAHAAGYAMLAYWTAYLKAHYPLEFMCARLTADMGAGDKLSIALEEARHLKLELLPPDINLSYADFTPEGKNGVRFGFNGIKNLGHNVVAEIVLERTKSGDFSSLDDLIDRVHTINSRGLESLIKVNGLSSFGPIEGLLSIYPQLLANKTKANKRDINQIGFFDVKNSDSVRKVASATPIPNLNNINDNQKLSWEKELLGIYFTSNPLLEIINKYPDKNFKTISANDLKEGADISGIAIIQRIKHITTRKGDPMAFVTLEDTSGTYDGVVFPKDFKTFKDYLIDGSVIFINGRVNLRDDNVSIIINKIKNLTLAIENDEEMSDLMSSIATKKEELCTVYVHESATTEDLSQLRDIFSENVGEIMVIIVIHDNDEIKRFKVRNKVDIKILQEIVAKMSMVEKVVFK